MSRSDTKLQNSVKSAWSGCPCYAGTRVCQGQQEQWEDCSMQEQCAEGKACSAFAAWVEYGRWWALKPRPTEEIYNAVFCTDSG
jgi:hypothetical protein